MNSPTKLEFISNSPIDNDLPGSRPDENQSFSDRQAFESIRARHDRALQANRVPTVMPQQGESAKAYEARLTRSLMQHATSYAPMNLTRLPGPLFDDIQQSVLTEALDAPKRRGELAPIRFRDQSGRDVTEYVGDQNAWLNQFRGPVQTGRIVVDGKPRSLPFILS